MGKNVWIVVAILLLVVGGLAAFYFYKKRNLEQFFSQIYEEAKKVPKQKKNSFLLLMFKESVLSSKNKSNKSSFSSKLQNPKYLQVQLVQMSNILKDTSKVEDKVMKRALTLLKSYQTWERSKIEKAKAEAQNKAS